jgi:hypothetical protein
MIEIMIQNLRGGLSEAKLSGSIFHQLAVAVIAGFVGFITFFTTLVIIKLFYHIIGRFSVFTIDTYDFLLSSIGFLCLFLISFLENSSKN